MAAEIIFEGIGPQPLHGVSFDNTRRTFELRAGQNGEYWCRVEYGWTGSDDSVNDAMVGLFRHAKHSESDVRCVSLVAVGEDTVGWLLTVKAITSNQHESFENAHFRRVAFSAARALLNSGLFTRTPTVNNEADVVLSDFFDDELSVLILHRPTVENLVSSSFAELLPSLHQLGFTPISSRQEEILGGSQSAADLFVGKGKTIRLKNVAGEVRFLPFVEGVFRDLLPSASNPILRFFVYYQLVEALLNQIFVSRQAETITNMVPVKESPVKLHPLIEKLREDASEKKRMRLLFGAYSGIEHKLGELLEACNAFLDACGYDRKENVADAFYEVRNLVFHDLRAVPPMALERLANVVEHLGFAVPELLNEYRVVATQKVVA